MRRPAHWLPKRLAWWLCGASLVTITGLFGYILDVNVPGLFAVWYIGARSSSEVYEGYD